MGDTAGMAEGANHEVLAERRAELEARGLERTDLASDPIDQFRLWEGQVAEWGVYMPEAMVLSTVDDRGRPSSRHVLLRGVDTGFVFFTNYDSDKAADLAANPVASLCFPWFELQRQVRIVGAVETVTADESDAYFATRPRGSQIGAWSSPQSAEIPDRAFLLEAERAMAERFADGEVPRPRHWGGYRVVPDEVEFWQGRPNRLHDRFRYRRSGQDPRGPWSIDRLAP